MFQYLNSLAGNKIPKPHFAVTACNGHQAAGWTYSDFDTFASGVAITHQGAEMYLSA